MTQLPGKPNKPFDIAGFLKRYWWKIPCLGGALFVLAAPLAMLKSSVFYSATGKLRVEPVVASLISRSDDSSIASYYHDYMRTEEQSIKNPAITETALKMLEPKWREVFVASPEALPRAADRLANRLEVKQVRRSQIIEIRLQAGKSDGLAELVNGVMEAYLWKKGEEEESKDSRRLDYLTQEKRKLEEEIDEETRALQEITREAKTSDFGKASSAYTQEVFAFRESYLKARFDRLEKQNRYEALQKEVEAIKALPLDAVVDELVANDQSLWRIDFWTYSTLQEMRKTLDGLSANNPDRKYVEQRMDNMQNYLESHRENVTKRINNIVRGKRDHDLQERLIQAKYAYQAASKLEEQLKEATSKAEVEAVENAQNILRGQQVQENLQYLKERHIKVVSRVNDIQVEAKAPLRVSIETPASRPRAPAGGNRKKLLLAALVFSFGSVVGAFAAYDFLDTRVRRPEDIKAAVGHPPTWPVSAYRSQDDRNIPFGRVTLRDPYHPVAKALRSLALRLDRERARNNARTALFTSVDPRSGTTDILLNVSAVMAKLCPKVLLVDFNLSSPAISRWIEASEDSEEIEALSCRMDFPCCIFHDDLRNIDVLPLGRLHRSVAQNREVSSLLEALETEYPFILVDSPPVLSSDLTEFLASRADLGVLVIHGDRTLYGRLRRTVEFLLRQEIPALTLVLNWGAASPKRHPLLALALDYGTDFASGFPSILSGWRKKIPSARRAFAKLAARRKGDRKGEKE